MLQCIRSASELTVARSSSRISPEIQAVAKPVIQTKGPPALYIRGASMRWAKVLLISIRVFLDKLANVGRHESQLIEKIKGLPVELGPARDTPRILNRDTLSFSSIGEAEIVLQQTPFHRLGKVDNDYSLCEELFQYGPVKLVDFLAFSETRTSISKTEEEYYIKQKTVTIHQFLNAPRVPTLSIIVPVAPGRGRELVECVNSIKQQTFLQRHPQKCELIIVQDGESTDLTPEPLTDDLTNLMRSFPSEARSRCQMLKLKSKKGRATARNIGIVHADSKTQIVFFIDSSMVLEKGFLLEQMLRHDRIHPIPIALVGFKEKLSPPDDYWSNQIQIMNHERVPDYRKDWKWDHELRKDEESFSYGNSTYRPGDRIRYMEITNYLKHLRGDAGPGARKLSTFFHTGITSVPLNIVKEIGGFDDSFDALWGFEDSFLGALLLIAGIKIVPCPSSVAFQIDHPEDPYRWIAAAVQQHVFKQRLSAGKHEFNPEFLDTKVKILWNQGIIDRIF